jgi:hypothetical protein
MKSLPLLRSIVKSAGRRILVLDDSETVPAQVVTYRDTHGLRGIQVTLTLGSRNPVEITLAFDKDDAIALMDHIQTVNSFAWRGGHPPDAEADETRPTWVKQWPDVKSEPRALVHGLA